MNEIESTKPKTEQSAISADAGFDAPGASTEDLTGAADMSESDLQTAPDAMPPDPPYMSFKYNHENVQLAREEATEWAQKGMHYFNKLDFVAAVNGTTVDALLKEIVEAVDRNKLNELQQKFGDDSALVDDLMTLFHNQNKEKYERLKSAREHDKALSKTLLAESLETQFQALQKDFPELESLDDVPADVLSAADEMPLMVAYVLYRHREDQKLKAAQQAAAAAAGASTGSVASNSVSSAESAETAFMKAFWR